MVTIQMEAEKGVVLRYNRCIICGVLAMFDCNGSSYCWEHLHGTTKPKSEKVVPKQKIHDQTQSHTHPFCDAKVLALGFVGVSVLYIFLFTV